MFSFVPPRGSIISTNRHHSIRFFNGTGLRPPTAAFLSACVTIPFLCRIVLLCMTVRRRRPRFLRKSKNSPPFCRATSDKKLKEQITLELSFVDSNLQLLREELAELNTSVQIYQNEKYALPNNRTV